MDVCARDLRWHCQGSPSKLGIAAHRSLGGVPGWSDGNDQSAHLRQLRPGNPESLEQWGKRLASCRHAARTVLRNLPTWVLSRLESRDSVCAAESTCEEADPVSLVPRCTPVMLALTCWVPCAACCTLREISWVAAPCSSTADAMVEAISDILSMVSPISLIAPTDSWVAFWIPVICWLISPVAVAVCSARAFTSEATTAKPRPASPARAASMVAFKASRLVCPAMVLMSSTTSPMRAAAFDNSLTRSLVLRA